VIIDLLCKRTPTRSNVSRFAQKSQLLNPAIVI
jgi:hypothetical protein